MMMIDSLLAIWPYHFKLLAMALGCTVYGNTLYALCAYCVLLQVRCLPNYPDYYYIYVLQLR